MSKKRREAYFHLMEALQSCTTGKEIKKKENLGEI
jgi:hypothetical protein